MTKERKFCAACGYMRCECPDIESFGSKASPVRDEHIAELKDSIKELNGNVNNWKELDSAHRRRILELESQVSELRQENERLAKKIMDKEFEIKDYQILVKS